MMRYVDLENHEWCGESEEVPNCPKYLPTQEPYMKLIDDRFKAKKNGNEAEKISVAPSLHMFKKSLDKPMG